ncbi:MAG TPA: hypothetical protein VIF62_07105 [Labilithrix sp.]
MRRLRAVVLLFAACGGPPAEAPRPSPPAIVRGETRATAELVGAANASERSYVLTSTAPRRDALPASPRIVREREDAPRIRTNSVLFDALYALAIDEAREASVAAIRDAAFDDGRPTPCACFETGRKWTYVWTRDTAYSTDLGLAALDPTRARSSLEYKLSERRGGGGLEVVQDTGSGGSWPVSTDRVVWALGASRLLDELDGDERRAFADRAFEAMRNTVLHDRAVVFDAADGLYRGEQSFLDWRAQTYPAWTATDTREIGLSKALSTNVLHALALETTARLAREHGDGALADRLTSWARDLRAAIRERFWREDDGLFATYLPTFFDPAAARRYDLLGEALAVLSGVADERQAARVVASYPFAPEGPPVVFPEEPDVPVYHNRAVWPFVTAYALLAARHVGNAAAGDRAVASLVRNAALNLSNMENFELATGDTAAPVVDSQRQLWSIAAHLAMVERVIFGRETSADGVRFRPWVTPGVHATWLGGAQTITLERAPFRGRRVRVVVRLPPPSGDAAYAIASASIDGRPIDPSAWLPASAFSLGGTSTIVVTLAPSSSSSRVRVVDTASHEALFAPRTPRVTLGPDGALAIDANGEAPAAIAYDVFHDGREVAHRVPGTTTTWRDASPASGCYTVESVFVATGNASHHARPACAWRSALVALGSDLPAFTVAQSGAYALEIVASNPGDVTTGITCAVRHVRVLSDATSIADGYVFVPHGGDASSYLRVRLEANRPYRVVVELDDRATNMSLFAHFSRYGGRGGRDGASNTLLVQGARLFPLP